MKVHILSKTTDQPSGGGNQFLKALEKMFRNLNIYEETAEDADIILFNSFNFLDEKLLLKLVRLKIANKTLVHRVDGPISLYRGKDKIIDNIIYGMNQAFATATIFQSTWSRNANYVLGMQKKPFETVIINAPDNAIFNLENKSSFSQNHRIQLIATSWSSNLNKGFDVYDWLDKNLDFKKYDMTFIGNTPIIFSNINCIPPLNSNDLAEKLKKADIYITASKKDPCSNSLIEALHCGLPAIALNDGGHPEIIGKAGKIFDKKEDIISLLHNIEKNYAEYQKMIHLPTIDQVAEKYINFFNSVNTHNKSYINYWKVLIYVSKFYLWKVKNKLW